MSNPARSFEPPAGLLPVADASSRPFWSAAALGVLSLPRCACSPRLLFPPPARCPDCLGSGLEWVTLSGRGRLWAWTEVTLPGSAEAGSVSVIAQVALDEQPTLRLLAADPNRLVHRLELGDAVRLVLRPCANGIGLAELAADGGPDD
ncbi:MAG: OB-fold domain-containing protein [Burkholderiaceae bacterium]